MLSLLGSLNSKKSQVPLTKNEREKTLRKTNNWHLGPENSFSPNLLFSILTKEMYATTRIIHTTMLRKAKGTGFVKL